MEVRVIVMTDMGNEEVLVTELEGVLREQVMVEVKVEGEKREETGILVKANMVKWKLLWRLI